MTRAEVWVKLYAAAYRHHDVVDVAAERAAFAAQVGLSEYEEWRRREQAARPRLPTCAEKALGELAREVLATASEHTSQQLREMAKSALEGLAMAEPEQGQ